MKWTADKPKQVPEIHFEKQTFTRALQTDWQELKFGLTYHQTM